MRRTMGMLVFRDLSTLHFIRCVAPVPGLTIHASGAAFTLEQAVAKCESEVIEREYEGRHLRPNGIVPVGIAAHVNSKDAQTRALFEASETLCIEEIHRSKEVKCCASFHVLGTSIAVSRTSLGFFCMIRGKLGTQWIGVSSAGPKLFSTLIKAWEEYRNVHFFKPIGKALKKYTKINKLFSQNELQGLRFDLDFKFSYEPQISALTVHQVERDGRKICYFTQTGGT